MMRKLLLVRHAERPRIPNGELGNDLSITALGEDQTKKFSEELSNVVSIHSSPILRCMQTSEIIADNCSYDRSNIIQSQLLGDPGFYISDGKLAWENWQKLGCDGVNRHLISGKETLDGFHNLDDAALKLSDTIYEQLSQSVSGTHIWLTHDTILAAYASRVLPEQLQLEQWPHYLGYLEVSLDVNSALKFRYVNDDFEPSRE